MKINFTISAGGGLEEVKKNNTYMILKRLWKLLFELRRMVLKPCLFNPFGFSERAHVQTQQK